jgi:hypothetical protein
MSGRPPGHLVRHILGLSRAQSIHSQGEGSGGWPSTPPKSDYFITSVVMRLGTSPTGTTAFTFMASVSMAVTDFMAALEM